MPSMISERRQRRESKEVQMIAACRVCTDGYFDASLMGDTVIPACWNCLAQEFPQGGWALAQGGQKVRYKYRRKHAKQ
jgi:hypothetical protein